MMRYSVNRLARFSSPDPLSGSLRNPQSLNKYAYVRSDPINSVDPQGRNGGPRYELSGLIDCWPECSTFIGDEFFGGIGGAIFGNDIFDAINGEPGTYLTLDMYGNLSFGFSIDLWQTTWNFIDAAKSQPGVPYTLNSRQTLPFTVPSTGYTVYVTNLGTGTQVSGFIPELMAAAYALQQQGNEPAPPPDVEAANSLYNYNLSLTYAGTNVPLHTPYEALMRTLSIYPDVADYYSNLYNYLASIRAVIQQYQGLFTQ